VRDARLFYRRRRLDRRDRRWAVSRLMLARVPAALVTGNDAGVGWRWRGNTGTDRRRSIAARPLEWETRGSAVHTRPAAPATSRQADSAWCCGSKTFGEVRPPGRWAGRREFQMQALRYRSTTGKTQDV